MSRRLLDCGIGSPDGWNPLPLHRWAGFIRSNCISQAIRRYLANPLANAMAAEAKWYNRDSQRGNVGISLTEPRTDRWVGGLMDALGRIPWVVSSYNILRSMPGTRFLCLLQPPPFDAPRFLGLVSQRRMDSVIV